MPQVTIVPTGAEFRRRSRRAGAGGRAAGGPQPAAQLQGRSLRVVPGARCCRAARSLSDARTAAGHHRRTRRAEGYALLCQAQASPTSRSRHARCGRRREVEVKSLPCRIDRMERARRRRDGGVPAPAGRRGPALPRRASTSTSCCRRAAAAASRWRARRRTASCSKCTCVAHRRAGSPASCSTACAPARCCASRARSGSSGSAANRRGPRVMIGGGTGYAPLRAMLRQLLATGDRRPLTLYWGARTTQDLYEHDWLDERRGDPAGLRLPAGAVRAAGRSNAVDGSQRASCTKRCLPTSRRPRRSTTSTRAARRRWSRRSATRSSSAGCRARSSSSTRSITRRTRWRRWEADGSSASAGACSDPGIRRVPEGTP